LTIFHTRPISAPAHCALFNCSLHNRFFSCVDAADAENAVVDAEDVAADADYAAADVEDAAADADDAAADARTLLQTLRTAVCGFHVTSLSWTSLPTEYSCTEPNLTPTTR